MAGNIGLNTGLRALLSSRFVLDTIGHNIANASTPGYSRQAVDLAAGLPVLARGVLVGSGVDAASVRRTVDTLLRERLLAQGSIAGRLESRYTGLSELQSLLREPDGASLGVRLDAFFGAASGLSTNPADPVLRNDMTSSGTQLAGRFQSLYQSLEGLRRDSGREVALRVAEVNELGGEIAGLNREVASARAAGLTPNDLMDRRDLLVDRLARLIDLETLEDPSGAVRVLVAGNTLVGAKSLHRMRSSVGVDGAVSLSLDGAAGTLSPTGGTLGGLVTLAEQSVPDLQADLDRLARNLLREVNRIHATGVPATGPYSSLVASNAVVDRDGDGAFRDELLSNAGLPFEVVSGELFVNVTDSATGAVRKHGLQISGTHTTVGELLDALSAIPNLSADVDALGRVQVTADTGYGFDFSPRLDPNPDGIGSFGGGQASLASAAAGPFALADGDTLTLDVGGTPISVSFATADFADISTATAEEVAAAVNANPAVSANGLRADAVDGRLVLHTLGTGAGTSFDLTGGTSLSALGWAGLAGSTVAGHDLAVAVEVSGEYTGAQNDAFTFVANADGTVGTTAGLTVDVLDSSGQRVATLDVGAGYVPGTALEVAEGGSVSFGLGELSATHNDVFALDVLAESDSAGALVALGLGGLFTGTGASDIALDARIAADPARLASSLSAFEGDNGVLRDLVELEGLALSGLGQGTLGEFYGEVVGDVGFEVASTVESLDANDALVQSLELRRDQVSGVNVDEELVNLLEFEQAFQAASRYINVLNQLNDDLLSLL